MTDTPSTAGTPTGDQGGGDAAAPSNPGGGSSATPGFDPVPGEVSSVLSGAAHNGQQVSNRDPESGTEEHEKNTIARPKEPSLRIAKGPGAKKPLNYIKLYQYFESIVQGAFSEALLDSGASHSFVSAAFCREHKISWRRMELAGGRQADGSEFAVLVKLCNATVKLGPLREKRTFLVAELNDVDVVLGADFLADHDPVVSWRRRNMQVQVGKKHVTLPAVTSAELPFGSEKVELCTIAIRQ